MKITLSVLLLMGLLFASCDRRITPKSDEDKTFYTIGIMFGSKLQSLELSDRELKAIYAGLYDSAKGIENKDVDINAYQQKVQETFRDRMTKSAEKVKKVGLDYIAKFLKESDVKKTESGLAYKIIKPGTGKKPSATDIVEVNYHGTLVDGTVFDSSKERGKPISFPLNRVIRGWTEGLQFVGVGGSIRLVIPSELAYGDQGAPPKIPGGSTLIFDVDLISVKDAGEMSPAAKK